MTTRKSIAAAQLAQLTHDGQFTKSGRRDRAPEQAAAPNAPGLYLLKPRETYRYSDDAERGVPPVRELLFFALIYTDVGSNASAVPADVIDDLLIRRWRHRRPTRSRMAAGRRWVGLFMTAASTARSNVRRAISKAKARRWCRSKSL